MRRLSTDRAPSGRIDLHRAALVRLDATVDRGRMAKQGWTDVARLTSRGSVAVNYGAREVPPAHQVGESVPIENLEIVYGVRVTFLESNPGADQSGKVER